MPRGDKLVQRFHKVRIRTDDRIFLEIVAARELQTSPGSHTTRSKETHPRFLSGADEADEDAAALIY